LNFQTMPTATMSRRPPAAAAPTTAARSGPIPDVLDVVAVVSNPVRYRSRYDLFRAFEAHVLAPGPG
jgi:hypothetical protein